MKQRKRWERKDAVLKKSQQSISMQRMKPMCVTFLPMIIIFGVISPLFSGGPVAISPMNPELIPFIGPIIVFAGRAPWISFTAWYMLCSLSLNSIIPRLLKTTTQTTGGGLSQMMSGQKAKALEFPDI